MTPTIVRELPLALIEPHQKNIRHDVGNVVDLSKSITAKGLLQPLVVAPIASGDGSDGADRYVLIAGHRRRAACILAGINDAPCIVRVDLDTEAKQLEAMLVENTQRSDLTVMEEARAIQGLLELPGFNADKVAKSIGRSRSYVKERGKLTALGEDAEKRLTDRQLTLEQALIVAEFEGDDYSQRVLLQMNSWATLSDWKVKAEELHRKREIQEKIPAKVQELRRMGAELLDSRPNWGELNKQGKQLVNATSDFYGTRVPEEYEGWTAEQHIAAGHPAVVVEETKGEPMWLVPRVERPEPELTEEDVERRAVVERIDAGLQVVAHTRMEHMKATLKDPPQVLVDHARDVLAKRVAQAVFKNPNYTEAINPFCEVATGKPADQMGMTALVRELQKLDPAQLAIIEAFARRKYEETHLAHTSGWNIDEDGYSYDHKAEWIDEVQRLWGWTLTDIEKEAIAHCDAQRAIKKAEEAERIAAEEAAGE